MDKEEKPKYYVECPICGKLWLVDDDCFEQEPWTHLVCLKCGEWIDRLIDFDKKI